MSVDANPAAGTFIMYSTSWCGYCQRLKKQLDREGITFSEINIEEHPAGADFVINANGGNQTVPTLHFSDGSSLTNPSVIQIKERLASLASE
ncbi:MAG: mycoredoxin [Actinobacteria bacterium]|jgi:mycoredoxin|nr:mycoredoxin [Actinomycetota bacterium]